MAAGVWVTLLPTHLPLDIQMVSVLLKLGSKMALTSGFPKIGNASEQLVNLVPRASAPSEDKPIHGFIEWWAKSEESVKALLVKGAQVNAVYQNGYTPLHYAASKNRHEIAAMLLEGGADSDTEDHCEARAMHWAAAKDTASDEGRVEETKLPVTQGASIYIENKEEKTPLQVTKGLLGLLLKRIMES
ncbi:hypothetical protein ACRRTK_008123 [Alexandromys fortis]